jgi:hypothetical protein
MGGSGNAALSSATGWLVALKEAITVATEFSASTVSADAVIAAEASIAAFSAGKETVFASCG